MGEAKSTEIRRTVSICNPRGLHARPAAAISKLVSAFEAHITVTACGEQAEADSIMDLLMLGAAPGTQVTLTATGAHAEKAASALAAFIERGFDEAPRANGD